ncbi:MAG: TonB-dependent receptor [Bacteroidales bacterium]
MKRAFIIIACALAMGFQEQVYAQDDTIRIGEVVINAGASGRRAASSRIITIDSSRIAERSFESLAALVAGTSSIYIRNYGPAGIATPSLRGTGAGYTKVAWNDIKLENRMLGQSDLSLIPAGLVDGVEIFPGGSSAEILGGAIGGLINLESKPDWHKGTGLIVNPGAGSFGRYSGLVKLSTGNTRIGSVTKAFVQSAENDFTFLNTMAATPVRETRTNNGVRQNGFMQEVYFRTRKNIVSARLWYQSAFRHLPEPTSMQGLNPGETQDDRSLRSMLTIESAGTATVYKVTGAFISDRLDYVNRQASIDSRNHSGSFILKGYLSRAVNDRLRLRLNVTNELTAVNSNNYEGRPTRNIMTVATSAEAALTGWLTANASVSGIIQDNRILSPDFSAGARIRPVAGKDYFLKAGFTRISKIPTLNDMYWLPGGNPTLKNETGFISELSWEMTVPVTNSLKAGYEIGIYRNLITDMILWHPGESPWWQADNAGRVITAGLESGLSLKYSYNEFSADLDAAYSFTRAGSRDINGDESILHGRQLIYVPANQMEASMHLQWKKFHSSIMNCSTGRRFVTSDNSRFIPGFSVTNVNLGLKFDLEKTTYDLTFMTENLFNVSYENIAWYPMPGRAFYVSFVFRLKK